MKERVAESFQMQQRKLGGNLGSHALDVLKRLSEQTIGLEDRECVERFG
jgi:hypothetical protein